MTVDELKKAIAIIKKEGHSDEEILYSFYRMYQDDKLTLTELDLVVNVMGYHLTNEFLNMSDKDKKTKGIKKVKNN